jgi:hypothetical protein
MCAAALDGGTHALETLVGAAEPSLLKHPIPMEKKSCTASTTADMRYHAFPMQRTL